MSEKTSDLERDTKQWRGIIAAVAEVAWLREAERLASLHDFSGERIAEQHARVWRSWGGLNP